IHSDDATDNRLARSGQLYANGAPPRMKRLSKSERELYAAQNATSCDSVRTEAHDVRTECHKKPLPDPDPDPVSISSDEKPPKPTAPPQPEAFDPDGSDTDFNLVGESPPTPPKVEKFDYRPAWK